MRKQESGAAPVGCHSYVTVRFWTFDQSESLSAVGDSQASW
jgi:hypothetical protein